MRITETFVVGGPPEVVFDYVTDPANLADWQTSKTSVEQLTDGLPGLGTRVRERTKPPGAKEFEQIVEFTEFIRPRPARMTDSSPVDPPTKPSWPAHAGVRTTEQSLFSTGALA
jgi:uncharacterized protein YndB with AHSA1/START domain